MNRYYIILILLISLVCAGGSIVCAVNYNGEPNLNDNHGAPPSQESVVTLEPTDIPTIEPTFTVEPTRIGGDYGWLSIDSSPQGADVSVDGSHEGVTPASVKIYSTSNPSHTITVTKSGYQEWTRHISENPASGETIHQTADLVEIKPTFTVEPTSIGGDYGWLSIDSSPQGADVSVDGSYEGVTPVSVKIYSTSTPSHTITVTKSGYLDWTRHISENPASGETIHQTAYLVEIQPTITIEPTLIGDDYGWFKIESAPSGADVYFDGSYYGTSPVLIKVMTTATPSHDIKVTMNGYRDYTQHLSNNPGRSEVSPLFAPLSPLSQYGSIVVTSDPSGALATLDSRTQYLTPCTFSDVINGLHTILVSKPGYSPYATQVQVNINSQQRVYAPLTMMRSVGTLFVDSYPQGADVKIDNLWQGQTPQRIGDLAEGTHTLKLQLSGYQTVTQDIMISQGRETRISQTLQSNPPNIKTGSVSVSSQPSGASVYLNNDYQGDTPQIGNLDLTDLTPGVYTILLKEPQCEDYSSTINVNAGQVTPVQVALKTSAVPSSMNGTLFVSSSPTGAQVFLDNLFIGITPLTLSTIKPGQYSLTIKMDGFTDYMNQVKITAGMSTTAFANLTASQTEIPTQSPTSEQTKAKSPLSPLLVPVGLAGALLLLRRDDLS